MTFLRPPRRVLYRYTVFNVDGSVWCVTELLDELLREGKEKG